MSKCREDRWLVLSSVIFLLWLYVILPATCIQADDFLPANPNALQLSKFVESCLIFYCKHNHEDGLITLHQDACQVDVIVNFAILILFAQMLCIELRAAIKQIRFIVQPKRPPQMTSSNKLQLLLLSPCVSRCYAGVTCCHHAVLT